MFDWGDGKFDWTYWCDSGEKVSAQHSWDEKGDYSIRVKAIDEHGYKSEWSDPLKVIMQKNKIININPLIIQFLENHPHLFPILRQILLHLG